MNTTSSKLRKVMYLTFPHHLEFTPGAALATIWIL